MGDLEGVDAGKVHAQFLATEHWSLLATRSMTWQEIFSRTGTYLTMLSACVVALSLVANATGFGPGFRTFALLVLPVALLVGFGTYFRLVEADIEDSSRTSSRAITTTRRGSGRPTASAAGSG
jgi:hypothetical protein